MSDIVSIDVSALIQAVADDENGTLAEVIESAVDERLSEAVEEAVSEYLRYSSDISDVVSDCVGDYVTSEIESLLDGVGPGNLCRLGEDFKSAIHCILKHHIDDWKNIFDDTEMANGNGASTEDIQKMVAEKFNKEMKVEVTFVDKKPAEVLSGDIN
jgi:hypothetical protein